MIRDGGSGHGVRFRAEARAAAAACALWFAACGAPKQAVFTLEGCSPVGFEPPADLLATALAVPVLEPGDPGSWDSADVLNPSVVRFGGEYLNVYSGFDGDVWRSGVARSADGVDWEKSTANPALAPDAQGWEGGYIAANGSALERSGALLYWYQAGPRGGTSIGLARSSDGERFEKAAAPVLEPGPPGAWDETAVGDPYALACGQFVYLFYLGQNRSGVQRLGVARSPDGVVWQKSHLNPLLEPGGAGEFDERGLGEPAVYRGPSRFWMLYTGRGRDERRALGWAESEDGVHWRKALERGVLRGGGDWNRAVLCDPTFWFEPQRMLIWYGGGSRPSPDEDLDGSIGFAAVSGVLGE